MAKDSGTQSPFVQFYAFCNRHVDVLTTPGFKQAFLKSYFLYKRYVEDPFARFLKLNPKFLGEGDIYDVGANLGYTAKLFAEYSYPQSTIFAFEPESKNFNILNESVKRLRGKIIPVHAAVGHEDGSITLAINSNHHADHKISMVPANSNSQNVDMTTLDSYWKKLGEKPVSFVKIDVQGFEPSVFSGMTEILAAYPDLKIAFEYDPTAMNKMGFDAVSFIQDLEKNEKKSLFAINQDGRLSPFTPSAVKGNKPYMDLVWMRPELLKQ